MSWIAYCDGACEPKNPGGTGTWAYVMIDEVGNEVDRDSGSLGSNPSMTNNIAEYHAVLRALRYAWNMPVVVGKVRTDSKLVVEQVHGRWACNAEHLIPLRDEIRELLCGGEIELEWVPRRRNQRADELSREAYRRATERAA